MSESKLTSCTATRERARLGPVIANLNPATSTSISFAMAAQAGLITYSGHQFLRHRIVLAVISGKPLKIEKIRSDDKNPGLRG
jgi:hypothetical protein